MEVKSYSTDKIVKGWQDTVMKPEEMLTFIPPLSDVYEAGKMCERQAEITFKAGERKVVEWLNSKSIQILVQTIPEYKDVWEWLQNNSEWQNFLKSLYGRIM